MLDVNQVTTALASGESATTEFKRQLENAESVAGELVAFANADGGTLYVGVDDNGAIVGLPDSNGDFQRLANICRDRCIPPTAPVMDEVTLDGKTVIVLTVRPELNRQKPYRTAGGRFYIRVLKGKRDATGRELLRIAQAAGELHYDESPVLGTSLADLSMTAFATYHQRQFGFSLAEQLDESGRDLPTLLQNLRLLHYVDGEPLLSVAGLLVFGEQPQRFLPSPLPTRMRIPIFWIGGRSRGGCPL